MLAIPRRLSATTLRWREEPGDLSRAGRWGARPDAPTCGPAPGVSAAKRAQGFGHIGGGVAKVPAHDARENHRKT